MDIIANPEIVPYIGLSDVDVRNLVKYTDILKQGIKPKEGYPTAFLHIENIYSAGMVKDPKAVVDEASPNIFLPIGHSDGYPAVEGIPIWENFRGEVICMYDLFKEYKNMPSRSIYKLAKLHNIRPIVLQQLSAIFYWANRVSAWDAYLKREQEQIMEIRRKDLLGEHYNTAKNLQSKCMAYIDENFEMFSPGVVVKLLEKSIDLERACVGLSQMSKVTNPSQQVIGSPTQINVNTNAIVNDTTNPNQQGDLEGTVHDTIETVDEAKTRMASMVNIMNQIGVLDSEIEPEVVEISENDIIAEEN